MKRILSLTLVLLLVLSLCGCARYQDIGWDEDFADVEKNPVATITMSDGSTIKLELYPKKAPQTVCNFIHLANSGFYDGLTFHRISPNFVIQGGDPDGNSLGGPGYSIFGEFAYNGFAQNDTAHKPGVISMARSSYDNNSAGSQFFICIDNTDSLNGQYAAFGAVIEGMDVCLSIAKLPVQGETPVNPPKYDTIRVETFGYDYPEPNKRT
ncbi:MAG: peptidylprolyl isomerase [Clostridia bacterium]|nr:peptidylprolyl isomerase [Clostridia bacterium]